MHSTGVAHGDIHGRGPLNGDLCFAFIDFGSSVLFSSDSKDHVVSHYSARPPSLTAAPEQKSQKPFDIFAADVYNLGRVLQIDLDEAVLETPEVHMPPEYQRLLKWMSSWNPLDRPTSVDALQAIRAQIRSMQLLEG